jgi:hypothetical protein
MPTPRGLRAVLHHPAVTLTVAALLVATSLIEIWESAGGPPMLMRIGATEMAVGAEDGILAYGLLNLLRALPELFEGVERAEEAGRR